MPQVLTSYLNRPKIYSLNDATHYSLYGDWSVHGDSLTVSLLHLDTDLADESGKVWTAYSSAAVSTAQKKFGAGSLYLDGVGGGITTAENNDFAFGTDPFTVDFWLFLPNGITAYQIFMGSGTGAFMLALNNSFTGIGFGRNNVAWDGSVSFLPSNVTWYHLEFGRDGSNAYIFVDGDLKQTFDVGTNNYSVTGTTCIGGLGSQYNCESYIEEFHVSKGCRHTESFTPPIAAY